jgi:hypothetical protein
MRNVILVLALLLVSAAPAARAGGGSFGSDDDTDNSQDAGPTFYGFVKTSAGDVVDDAKITVTVKSLNSSMILRTDSQGHYLVRGFDKSIDPGDVNVDCSKDGFKEVQHVRKPSLYPNAPIEVDCILDHQ